MLKPLYQKDILKWVSHGDRVLDLGCGGGDLLLFLKEEKNIQAVGIDVSESKVIETLSKGISAIQADIDLGLSCYSDNRFDVIILNQTLQMVKDPLSVLKETIRIGKKTIVFMANFGHWFLRCQIFFKGRMPKNKTLDYEWYNTPNIRLTSLSDINDILESQDIKILHRVLYGRNGKKICLKSLSNLLSENFLFVLSD